MIKRGWIIVLLMTLTPVAAMAETVEGKLGHVSFQEQTIEVNGMVYQVNVETTRVTYRGERMGEEDLRPGDDVILVFGEHNASDGKRQLDAVILIRGSKSGLES